MNVCSIKYPGGICTNVSANQTLVTQNLSIVLFVNNSVLSDNTSAVSAYNQYSAYNSLMLTHISTYNTSLSGYTI